jgi:hypothetical protein
MKRPFSSILFAIMMIVSGCQPTPTSTPQPDDINVTAAPENRVTITPEFLETPLLSQAEPNIPIVVPSETPTGGIITEPMLHTETDIANLQWSPNGEWIAFKNGIDEVFTVNSYSGEMCPGPAHDFRRPKSEQFHWSWQANSRILEVEEGAFSYSPCNRENWEPIEGLENARAILTNSPDRRMFVLETTTGYRIYNSETGEVLQLESVA